MSTRIHKSRLYASIDNNKNRHSKSKLGTYFDAIRLTWAHLASLLHTSRSTECSKLTGKKILIFIWIVFYSSVHNCYRPWENFYLNILNETWIMNSSWHANLSLCNLSSMIALCKCHFLPLHGLRPTSTQLHVNCRFGQFRAANLCVRPVCLHHDRGIGPSLQAHVLPWVLQKFLTV